MNVASDTFQEMAQRMGRQPGQSFDRNFAGRQAPVSEPLHPVQTQSSFARLLLAISTILVALAAIILSTVWLVGDEISRAGHSADPSVHQLVVGNDVLNVPGNMIRFRSQRRSSMPERLDLYMLWPRMEGYSIENAAQFDQAQINPAILFVTIEPRQMTQDMSGRIKPIYSKFLSGQPQEAGYGLIRQELSAAGGFADEELWFEALSPYPFAARCIRDEAERISRYCLRDIHMGQDLTVTYRFHKSLIGEWMALEAAIRSRLNSMISG